ncbi:Zinc finger CCHC domain-containing protein 8 [Heterocephalus glaber]|uniref:Zinc finger CCHC domain-containing protein 8 n=1 Tax=Heterocephalus glaber TaxID=10181 RepID=G5AWQ9_HETGA|nr:Zinc finger CCHC domain-containing protein 8 [Heterocephalus glaber]
MTGPALGAVVAARVWRKLYRVAQRGSELKKAVVPPYNLRPQLPWLAPPLLRSFPPPKMAAEVDFGDLELFEAFDPPEESTPKPVHTRFKDDDGDEEEEENGGGDAELRERLRQCEETLEQLRAENILPAGRALSPALQYHQEIEEFVSNLVKRFEEQQKNDVEKTSFNLLPQPSSIVLEEDHKIEESCTLKNSKEAFSPRNAARISEKRKEYMDACSEANNQSFQQRYHAEEVEERFGRFKPGVISEELQDALGVTDKSLPPFIYRMRQLGYPPGWLKEAELENSGLALYDGKGVEWRMFGSIPMQACQQKDVFANYLSSNFQVPSVKSSGKRSSLQSSSGSPKKQRKEGSSTVSPADMELDSEEPGAAGRPLSPAPEAQKPEEEAEHEAAALGNGAVESNCDLRNGDSGPAPASASQLHSPVPDMSKFAMGITPFEFENMAESTGMYLRIRSLLRNSPRNQQKNKKAPE